MKSLLIILLLLPALAHGAAVGPYTVTGQVQDRQSGEALAGAEIVLPDGSRMTSDAEGRFTLDRADAELFFVRVRHEGYAPRKLGLQGWRGKTMEFPIGLDRLPTHSEQVVVLGKRDPPVERAQLVDPAQVAKTYLKRYRAAQPGGVERP